MGATPKPPGQRVRRNREQSEWRQLPAGGRSGRAPKPRTSVVWGEFGQAYWRALWSSPMAATYTEADVFPLTRLCSLVDRRERVEAGDPEVFAASSVDGEVTVVRGFDGDGEIRQLEDRFGISPLARRRLQWEVAQAERSPSAKRGPAEVRKLRAV